MWPFLCSDRVPLCPLSGKLLSQMEVGLFSKAFSASIEIYGFVDIEKFLHRLDESHLIMLCGPFNVLLDLVCYCLVENFVSMFIIDIAL